MKKLFLVSLLIMLAVNNYGQRLPKGSLLGLHSGAPAVFNEGYTLEKYVAFLNDKYIPAFEKNWPGVKLYLIKGKRGECENCLGFLQVFESDKVRDKYFVAEGQLSEAGKASVEKMKQLDEESYKYLKSSMPLDKYTDWIIQ